MPKNTVALFVTLLLVADLGMADRPVIGELLETLSRQAPEIRAKLTGMKLVDLPMSYRQGRRLETYQRLTVKSVERLEKILPVAKQRPSLGLYYLVSIELRILTENLQQFSDLLDQYSFSDSIAQEKASTWADAGTTLLEPLHASMLDFEDSLHVVLEKADSLIDTCETESPN